MGLSPAGGRDGRGGITGCGDLCLLPSEHSRTAHYNQAHYGYVSGVGMEYGVKGGQAGREQDILDFEGMRTAAWEAERTEGGRGRT